MDLHFKIVKKVGVLMIFTTSMFSATLAEENLIDIAREWRFVQDKQNVGEKESWYGLKYDDSSWHVIDAGRTLGQERLDEPSGTVWYRKWVAILQHWQGKTIYLAVGGVKDSYVLYINGEMHAENQGEKAQSRVIYPIENLKAGADNLIAFQVNCRDSGGGLYQRPFALALDPAALGGLAFPIFDGWQLKSDPENKGLAQGWFKPGHADELVPADESSQPQRPGGDERICWFSKRFHLPEFWGDEPVYLFSRSMGDEFDLFINGRNVGQFGKRIRKHSDIIKPFSAELTPFINRTGDNWLVLRVADCGAAGGTARLPVQLVSLKEQPEVSPSAGYELADIKEQLPVPILGDHPDWIELYWKSWEIALKKVKKPTLFNGFVTQYMDEAFSDNIFQWDTCFMILFGRYAWHAIPAVQSLDNFYEKQDADGFICREIREADGVNFWDKHLSLDTINPPIFSWVEWQSYLLTGDDARLARILPNVVNNFDWLEKHRRWGPDTDFKAGLYWSTGLACGMDDSPRTYERGGENVHEHHNYSWIDMTAQQGLNAFYISKIAGVAGEKQLSDKFLQKYVELAQLINVKMWDADDGFYYDLDPDGKFSQVKTLASYWPMVAGMTDKGKNDELVAHLKDPKEFWRPHLFPSLSADHSLYHPKGHYWKGGVWAPTNFMVVKALEYNGYEQLATAASENHLRALTAVYKETGTLWENYAPESFERGDISRGDFVGWTGCGPIALLIENILGFRVNAAENSLTWRLTRTTRHGMANLRFGSVTVSLVCEERSGENQPLKIHVKSNAEFQLKVINDEKSWQQKVSQGEQTLILE